MANGLSGVSPAEAEVYAARMIRGRTLAVVAVLLISCFPNLTSLPCQVDTNCPGSQVCVNRVCVAGATADGGRAGGSSGGGSVAGGNAAGGVAGGGSAGGAIAGGVAGGSSGGASGGTGGGAGGAGGGDAGGVVGGGASGGQAGGAAAGGEDGGAAAGGEAGGEAGGAAAGGVAGGGVAGGGTGGATAGGTGGATAIAQVNAVIAAFDSDAGFNNLPVDSILVTYVAPYVDAGFGRPTPWGFFVQAAPDGPALYVDVLDAGVRAGDVVSFVVTGGIRFGGLRQVNSYSNLVRSSSNNPVSGYARDVSAVDFTVPQNFETWENRLIRLTGTPQGPLVSAGNGFSSISVSTTGVPDAGPALRFRMPLPSLVLQDLGPSCQLVLSGTPLGRFNTTAQPVAFFDTELTGTTCPQPNLVSATAIGSQTVVATFDRALAPATVLPQFFSIDAGIGQLGPAVTGATLTSPRVVTLQTAPFSPRLYELGCTTAVTDGRGRPVLVRTQPFVGN